MKQRKNTLYLTIFLIIFICLTLIATFYDLEISTFLAKKWLINGRYSSTNIFANIIEIIGEMPIYPIGIFAASIISIKSKDIKNKFIKNFLKIGFIFVSFGLAFYGWYKVAHNHYVIDDIKHAWAKESYAYIIEAILAIIVSYVSYKLCLKIKKETLDKLFYFAIVIAIAGLLSQIANKVFKQFVGRERFRALCYLDELKNYTRWYQINGRPNEILATYSQSLNVKLDYFKSYPSGHVASCSLVLVFFYLPKYITINKKYNWMFIVFPIAITLIVFLGRIVAGAHFFSDVLFGFMMTYVIINITNYFVIKYIKKT